MKENQQKLVRGRVWGIPYLGGQWTRGRKATQRAEDSRQARGPLVDMEKGDKAILHSMYGCQVQRSKVICTSHKAGLW